MGAVDLEALSIRIRPKLPVGRLIALLAYATDAVDLTGTSDFAKHDELVEAVAAAPRPRGATGVRAGPAAWLPHPGGGAAGGARPHPLRRAGPPAIRLGAARRGAPTTTTRPTSPRIAW